MDIERIKQIQKETVPHDSVSVQQALLKVWNECSQEQEQVKNRSIPDVVGRSESLPEFESLNKPDFLRKYKDACSEELLLKIWEFGNKRWSDGYKQGKRNPDFD